MPSSKETFPLRLKPINKERIRVVAEREDRPISAQIERILETFLAEYEAEHGPILPDRPIPHPPK